MTTLRYIDTPWHGIRIMVECGHVWIVDDNAGASYIGQRMPTDAELIAYRAAAWDARGRTA